jgi:hypothetical protein
MEIDTGNMRASEESVRNYLMQTDGGNLSAAAARAVMKEFADELAKGIALRSLAYYVGDRMLERLKKSEASRA